jgi:hypothetical protein
LHNLAIPASITKEAMGLSSRTAALACRRILEPASSCQPTSCLVGDNLLTKQFGRPPGRHARSDKQSAPQQDPRIPASTVFLISEEVSKRTW